MSRSLVLMPALVVAAVFLDCGAPNLRAEPTTHAILESIGAPRGIVAVVDLPDSKASAVIDLARENELLVHFQSDALEQVRQVRELAAAENLLGIRIFVDRAPPQTVGLSNNIADAVLVAASAAEEVSEEALIRVLRPKGTLFIGDRRIVKPVPAGIDEWTHPYHGPDNNPQSKDQLARGEFRTQFIERPKFSPMPEQTVIAGGRLYKALGHIAHKQNQNEHLNTLLGINAYNGVVLWKRPLPDGFMIHRNTMIATGDSLYLGDDESCKVLDGKTGDVREEITIAEELSDGPVWKWMALRGNVLYALLGNKEVEIDTQRSRRRGLGHWPWGMWKGHDYLDPRTAFGFGRTLVAIDLETKKTLWHRRTEEFLDARGVAMNSDNIFAYAPGKSLLAINVADGKVAWRRDGGKTLDAIGPNGRAQHYVTGYATTCYMKCTDDYLFFAGPQRSRMVAVSAHDGELAWTHPDGNLQLVLRDDAIYAAGPTSTGVRLDYATGEKLGALPTRRACTRATGGVDSVFYRANGGTVRVLTDSNVAHHIAAMRPPCQDGVLISNGHLYWGPWMCGCQLSLYGNIGLGAADDTYSTDATIYDDAHTVFADGETVTPLKLEPNDWPAFRGGNDRADTYAAALPADLRLDWQVEVCMGEMPTAPVAGGGMVFVADRTGAVHAFDAKGQRAWKQHVSGPIYFPPALAEDRVFVGSADGRVYAFEARSGRPLWSFRVAPADRRINVFGQLISRWPVAGGVVVEDRTVYAAAGIVNYDGTYVVALDAVSGKLKRRNSTSGALAPKVNGGVSLQGPLGIANGELRFLGGGVYATARYDLESLKCRNEPSNRIGAGTRTAFYPYYPQYGKFVSLQQNCADGLLCFAASYEGSSFGNIALQTPPERHAPSGEEARAVLRRRGRLHGGKRIWQDARDRRFTSFVISPETLMATGHTEDEPEKPFILGMRIRDGADLFSYELPADAVKSGIAVDHTQRVYVTLENGRLLSFAPRQREPSKTAATPQAAQGLPETSSYEFLAARSMKPFPKGSSKDDFPVQRGNDGLDPLRGSGVYFHQRGGEDKDVYYRIESVEPIREIRFKGAATFGMTMDILDVAGSVVRASAGPFDRGNTYSEHTLVVPEEFRHRFLLRFRNEASNWFYIERVTLKGATGSER